MPRGGEQIVQAAFVAHLTAHGWAVREFVEHLDVLATKNGDVIRAEVKGPTGSNMNLDIDTMYGQLLRRMKDDGGRYGVVVPPQGVAGAARVPPWLRERLRVDIYEVDVSNGAVRKRDDV